MPVTIGGSGPITGVTSINTTVSDTELGYLDGVSSALQTQINAKANDSSQGLYLITPTSIANSGGSASASGGAVTFSGGTSLSLNGIFSSTYANYRVVVALNTPTADLNLRMRASGADNTTSNYTYQTTYFVTTTTYTRNASQAQAVFVPNITANDWAVAFDIINPNVSARTLWTGSAYVATANQLIGGSFEATTVFDGFSLYCASAFSATLRVYGYRNS